MKKSCSTALAALLLLTFRMQAAESGVSSPDFQARIPFHIQYADPRGNSLGLAAWVIFPDITAKGNETGKLSLIGPLWNYDKKGSWLEVMGGVKTNENGYNDPVVDLRLVDRTLPKVSCALEVGYFPREKQRRLFTSVSADTPISIGTYQMRIGIESENVFFYSGKKDSLGLGPRLVFPIPLGKASPALSSSLTLTYQRRNDLDFVRCYAGVTWKFAKK